MKKLHKKPKIWVAFLVTGIFIASLSTKALAQNKNIKDSDIAQAIEADFSHDDAVPSQLIDVTTSKGKVTLSGSVNNLNAKERAPKIVESIKGVRSVVNQIKLKSVERKDSAIQADVENALRSDPVTDLNEETVNIDNGVVALSGKVDSMVEKKSSARVAKSVRGVTDINNNLKVVYQNRRPDSEIKPEVKKRLKLDPYVDEELINVNVKNGKVILDGTIGSVSEKYHATIASQFAGVSSVNTSDLETKQWARDEMKKKTNIPKISAPVEKILREAFIHDPRMDGSPIKIDVNYEEGNVALDGVVDSFRTKEAARQDAKNIKGIIAVNNNIKVIQDNN